MCDHPSDTTALPSKRKTILSRKTRIPRYISEECGTFMRKLGLGGPCPHCDEPVAVTELLDQEVMLKD